MRFFYWLIHLFVWTTVHTKDGGQTHYNRYHPVLPWFCSLRIPIDKRTVRDIFKLCEVPFFDRKSGDEVYFCLRTKTWYSITIGTFKSLKELRQFWRDYEEAEIAAIKRIMED